MPRETVSNTVDYSILGVPLSAVEQQDPHRKDKVKKLIEKFENPNKESFHQHFKQTKEINEFSKKAQDFIADMNNTEIFELCETSSKQQCPDCNLYLGNGNNPLQLRKKCKIYADSNGVRPEQPWRHHNPWICDEEKTASSRGVKHGASERQKMQYQARQMLEKVRQGKHGRHPTILSRWYGDEDCIKSAVGGKNNYIMLYDGIAVVKRIYIATRAREFKMRSVRFSR